MIDPHETADDRLLHEKFERAVSSRPVDAAQLSERWKAIDEEERRAEGTYMYWFVRADRPIVLVSGRLARRHQTRSCRATNRGMFLSEDLYRPSFTNI